MIMNKNVRLNMLTKTVLAFALTIIKATIKAPKNSKKSISQFPPVAIKKDSAMFSAILFESSILTNTPNNCTNSHYYNKKSKELYCC